MVKNQSNISVFQNSLDSIMLSKSRFPSIRIVMFDDTDSFSDIVLGKNTQIPLDLSNQVESIQVSESIDQASTLSIEIILKETQSPYLFMGRKFIKVLYRDKQQTDNNEITIFTGTNQGQPGFKVSRGERKISLSCIDRSFFFVKESLESKQYLKGEDFGDVITDIATNSDYGLGLQREEVKIGLLRELIKHESIQIFDVPKMEGLNLIGFVFDLIIRFNNSGFLVAKDSSLTKLPIRFYQDNSLIINYEWPQNNLDINNFIRIIGLDINLSKVISPNQVLGRVSGTIGYFQKEFKTKFFFTEDKKGRAQNTRISESIIDGNLNGFLGSSASLKNANDFSVVVVVSCPFQAYIFLTFFSVYVGFFITKAIFGSIFGDFDLLAAAIWLTAGLAIMQQMGTFEVEISGEPFELVYKEIISEAGLSNIKFTELRTLEIENHIIGTQEQADEIALRELIREVSKGNTRRLTIPFDPIIETSDIIELSDGTRYYVTSKSYSYKRNSEFMMDLDCFVVRSGPEFEKQNTFSEF